MPRERELLATTLVALSRDHDSTSGHKPRPPTAGSGSIVLVAAVIVALIASIHALRRSFTIPRRQAALGMFVATLIGIVARVALSPWVELTSQGVAYRRSLVAPEPWLFPMVLVSLRTLGAHLGVHSGEMVNLVLSLLTPAAVFFAGGVIFGDARRAFVAALIIALSPDAIAYATTLRESPTAALAISLAFAALVAHRRSPSDRSLAAAIATGLTFVLTRKECFVEYGWLIAATWLTSPEPRPTKWWLPLGAVPIIGAVYAGGALGGSELEHLTSVSLGSTSVFFAGVLVVALAATRFGPRALAWIRARGDGGMCALAGAGVVVIALSHDRDNLVAPYARYLLPAEPLLALAAAAALFSERKRPRILTASAVVIWALPGAFRLPMHYNDQEEFRFFADVNARLGADDRLLSIASSDLPGMETKDLFAKADAVFGARVKRVQPVSTLFGPTGFKAPGSTYLLEGIDSMSQITGEPAPVIARAHRQCSFVTVLERTIPNHPFDWNSLDEAALGERLQRSFLGWPPPRELVARELTLRLSRVEECYPDAQ